VILAQVIIALKKDFSRWLKIYLMTIVFLIPLAPLLILQLKHLVASNFIPTPGLSNLIYAFFIETSNYILLAILVILAYISLINSRKHLESRLLFLTWIIPIILPFLVSLLMASFFSVKYTIPATIGLFVLSSEGVTKLRKYAKPLTLIIIIAMSFFTLKWYYTHPQKEDWRAITKYLDDNVGPKDRVIFYPGFTKNYVFDYYSKKNLTTYVLTYETRPLDQSDIEHVKPMVGEYHAMWLVLSHYSKSRELMSLLEKTYPNVTYVPFRKIDLYIFRT
jgi:hypothetical protein